MAPRVKMSELWRVVARLRYDAAKKTHDAQPPTAEVSNEVTELMRSGDRAMRNMQTSEVSEHWAETGWHQPGASARPGDRMGRGWHDAHLPSKLPS